MDREKFTAPTGELVPVSVGHPDWAFIPRPLPREWEISAADWPLLAHAKEELARLDGIGRALPNPDLMLRPLNNREAIRSSSLEGTYASPQELLLFQLDEVTEAAITERANSWMEVHNYALALRHGENMLYALPLSLRIIREMHRVLLTNVRGRERDPGEFRRVQVHVGTDKRYIPPPPGEIDHCINDLERFLNEADRIDPLVRVFLAHYQFEAIHPFLDGNGRVGRALMTLCAFQWSRLWRPWLYMSPYFDRNKEAYIDLLFGISTTGAWREWIEFCLHGVIEVCGDAIRRCDELLALHNVYHRRASTSGSRMYGVVEALFNNPFLRIAEVARRFDVTYPTAKADVGRLVKMDLLEELPDIYPKTFVARPIFDAAYGEP
jgi:Fic family protein